jgi:hypothetical protein
MSLCSERGLLPPGISNLDDANRLCQHADTNAGNPLSATERNQLIRDLTANTKTRARRSCARCRNIRTW